MYFRRNNAVKSGFITWENTKFYYLKGVKSITSVTPFNPNDFGAP